VRAPAAGAARIAAGCAAARGACILPPMPTVKLAELIDQPAAASFLRGVVAGGRFANAYLFHGAPGVGKGTAALAFARALLCERGAGRRAEPAGLFDAPLPAAGPADDACGECPACLKAASLQHPDLRFLFPVSGEERDLDETVAETLAAWREDPLFVFAYEKFASIRLSLTHDVLRELAFKPFEAVRRVVVVRDADRMREDEYSALLKAIEEPGASTVWVLTTARLHRLPATIRSRCQRVRFTPLAETTITAFLERRAGTAAGEARLLGALASGSLARALMLREQRPLELRNQALALLDPALRGIIEVHELWLRDLLRARYGAARAELVNRDREAEIRRQAASLDAREIRRRLMVLEEILRAIEGNVSPDLALFSGLARVAGQHLGEGEWPLHAAGRWDY